MTVEPNWLDPEEALRYKIILYGVAGVKPGQHWWSLPFKPDNLDGMWRSICTCGAVFGPLEDTGEKVCYLSENPPEYLTWELKVINDLFYAARNHATQATKEQERNVQG